MKELWEVIEDIEKKNKGLICKFSIYLRTNDKDIPLAGGTYDELAHVLVLSLFQREVVEVYDFKSYTTIVIK